MRTCLLAALLCVAAVPARAEVKSASEHGFELEHRLASSLPPDRLFRAFADLPRWWSKDHSYSGSAANLRLELRAGGCWCEKLRGGGEVEHMRLVHFDPPRRLVFLGSLGPLRDLATTGVLQVSFASAEKGSTLILNYKVAGFASGGAARIAPLVDRVLGIQLTRLDVHAESLAARR
jgi:uncharacterized protein YndB with AHSA1/START domain